jgi:hypothetical protein
MKSVLNVKARAQGNVKFVLMGITKIILVPGIVLGVDRDRLRVAQVDALVKKVMLCIVMYYQMELL